MKALILAGGQGTRLRPLTFTSAKQLIPVANKPVLVRVIETILKAGISEIGMVVGNTASEIKTAVGTGERWGVSITYIPQKAPLGLAHAVKISQDFLGQENFVMFLGDNIIQGGITDLAERFELGDANCQVTLKEVNNPTQFGVAEVKGDKVRRLIEKPEHPPSNLALMGIYFFDHHIFQAVHAITPSARGELEITDAIQWLLDRDFGVNHVVHKGFWIDTGKMEDLLHANDLLLDEEAERRIKGYVDQSSQIIGRVTIEEGAKIENSTIRGPAVIGPNSRVTNAYIGPYTSISHSCHIDRVEIARSIVLEGASITNLNQQRIEDSLIGRFVIITGSDTKPQGQRFKLGDYSEVTWKSS